MATTVIQPYSFHYNESDTNLIVSNQETGKNVLTISPLKPLQEELEIKQINLEDYFNLEISLNLKEELDLNDIQIEVFRTFLDEVGYFNN